MAYGSLSDILWISLDLEAKACVLDGPKKLTDMCLEKLVSDISLITQHAHSLPKSIHSRLLCTAVSKKRTLSIEQLMKTYPLKELELPVPDIFKSTDLIYKLPSPEINNEYTDFIRVSVTILSVFLGQIVPGRTNSKLQSLNLGLIPQCSTSLSIIADFMTRLKEKSLTKTYTLRCAFAVESSKELFALTMCIEGAILLGLNFEITGIYFYNNYFPDVQALRIFDFLSISNLKLIGLSFAKVLPRMDAVFQSLQHFKLMRYLNLSYSLDVNAEQFLSIFSETLAELSNLQRLVLKGIPMTNKLTMMFLKHCKKSCIDVTVPNCCIVHSGSLHYLDIASCGLSDGDLEFLREMALSDSLKFLDISSNVFCDRSFEILLSLKNSLLALNISSSFKQSIEYDAEIFPFSSFTELKYLNINRLWNTERSMHLLEHEFRKMPHLEIFQTSDDNLTL